MRIAVANIAQETDTFNPVQTQLDAYRAYGLRRGQEMIDEAQGAGMVGGFLAAMDAANEPDLEVVPLVRAKAVAAGRVSASALAQLTDMLTDSLRQAGDLDGLALLLHGACAAIGVDDVEGHLLAAVRSVVGPELPIVVGLDHHANVTTQMVELSEVIVGHRTQPHDQFDTGRLVGELVLPVAAGRFRPQISWRKLRLLSHQEQYLTSRSPMKIWFDRAREMESIRSVLSVSPFPMQPWLDVEEGGWSAVVVTDGEPEVGERLAEELADLAWSMREQFQVTVSMPASEAVAVAAEKPGLVVISDTGDSIFGGAAGDSTVLLAELMQTGNVRALVPLVDPSGVRELIAAGIGAQVDLELGGGVTGYFSPVRVSGVVTAVDEPTLRLPNYPEDVVHCGPVALVQSGSVMIAVSQQPGIGGNHPGVYRHFGLEPAEFDVAVLKTASNFQYYRDLTTEVIRANTPGPTQSDISSLAWKRVPRPIFPLDDGTVDTWRGGVVKAQKGS